MNDIATPSPLPVRQGQLFWNLRWALLRNAWHALAGTSLVRPVTILLCSLVVWVFVFVISYSGFRFLVEVARIPADEQIVGLLLALLFFTLGLLLIFSTGLILYGSLFTGPETAFLLSKPVRDDQVFAYKFQGAVAFSSWAFLLLGGPILIAYGLVCHGPWYFYVALPFFFLGFVLLPGSVGGMVCLLLVNYVPRRRKQVLAVVIALVLFGVGGWIWSLVREAQGVGPIDVGQETASLLLYRISFARSAWMPSSWVARGLQAAGRGDLATSGYYLALLWSNGLFLYLITAALSVRLYRRGYNRLATGGDLRRRHGGAWLDRMLEACLPLVRPGTRLLIVKDFRTFRRDPQQWGQVLLFTALLVAYFANVRRMFSLDAPWAYRNSLSLLNLCVIALLLCTYTGRFIYPLLSMEGRKFWVLGLLPLQRDQLLWGKFVFSTIGGLLLSEGLMLLSDLMLEMPPTVVVLHLLTVGVLAAGLSGLSVGLGACMPNFKESDPSKIAVGFGGTLNLVAGLLFLLAILALMAGPWHGFMFLRPLEDEPSPYMLPAVLLGAAMGLVVGVAAVIIPLRAGVQALRRMEF
jgi:ABC-2 type transport system permease protein